MSEDKVTLIVDSGADISLFKINKVRPDRIVNIAKKNKLTRISDKTIETLASTDTEIFFENGLKVKHSFQLVSKNFPIQTDGILGRDFLTTNRCKIDYDSWLLHFDIGNKTISIPIEDNFKDGFILPQRSETIRKLSKRVYPSDMVVHAQEIQTGFFFWQYDHFQGRTICKIHQHYK